jgi:hypothetical protein
MNQSLQTGMPLVRLRKMVAFERFLARLFSIAPEQWVVKGGLALQLRLGGQARTTKDVDMLALVDAEEIFSELQKAGRLDLGDHFVFIVAKSPEGMARAIGGIRYPVRALLDGRIFESFHLDVGVDDPMVDPVEYIEMPALLAFAEIPPTKVPCFPVTQQIAEKFHAYTRPRGFGESSRVKDFVDILLLSKLGALDGRRLYCALLATFERANTHPLPERVPPPPVGWKISYRRMAKDVGLENVTIEQAYRAVQAFLEPILSGKPLGHWQPEVGCWREGGEDNERLR